MMASIKEPPASPAKRALSLDEEDGRAFKKQRFSYHRYHALQHQPQWIPPEIEPALLEQSTLDKLLIDAIKAVCEEKCAQAGIENPVIESLALEAFRNATEEFALRFCLLVRRSMLAARRTAPIAPDFDAALEELNVEWPKDQLEPYLTKPAINPPLLPTPPPEDPFQTTRELPADLLGSELDGKQERRRINYIPSNLPAFPSPHTYKDTPVYQERENDPRRIRELATEEGKLGEEAIRKLAGAVKAEKAIVAGTREELGVKVGTKRKPEQTIETLFQQTMQELMKSDPTAAGGKFELGPIVNCEKKYRMPDISAPSRAPGASDGGGTGVARSQA